MAKKSARIVVAYPNNRGEAETLAATIGERLRRIERQKLDASDAVAKVKDDLAKATAADTAAVKVELATLCAWATQNRDEILPKDRKSIALPAGVIGWRIGNPTVTIADEEQLIAQLRAMGRDHLIVESESVSKEGILRERAELKGLPGIQINQTETFYFSPLDVEKTVETKIATTQAAEAA
jgi:phage host-nuclease inhibitor protein Gam